MGQQRERGEGVQQSAAIIAAAAGYHTVNGANYKGVGIWERCCGDNAKQRDDDNNNNDTECGGHTTDTSVFSRGSKHTDINRRYKVMEQCDIWRTIEESCGAQITVLSRRISNASSQWIGYGKERWDRQKRGGRGIRATVWTRAKFASTKCRELEGRRRSWRHAAEHAQQRHTVTIYVWCGDPDRNTAEWPPDYGHRKWWRRRRGHALFGASCDGARRSRYGPHATGHAGTHASHGATTV